METGIRIMILGQLFVARISTIKWVRYGLDSSGRFF
jgi:hypothetical protein